MPLTPQNIQIPFIQGLDTKTDPFQVSPGKFLSLQNSVFNNLGLLQKRNGFQQLTSLPNNSYSFLTTYNGNLTAISQTDFQSFAQGSQKWLDKGSMQSLSLSTLSLIKNGSGQSQADAAVSNNNLVCTTYLQASTYYYAIVDTITGQNVVAPTAITSTGVVTYTPKVFSLGNYFIIVFDSVISTVNHLQYIAINVYSLIAKTATDLSTAYTPASTGTFDGIVANNNLYLAWNGNDSGNAIRITYIDATLVQHGTKVFAGTNNQAALISVCADITSATPIIYISWYRTTGTNTYMAVVDHILTTITAPILIYAGSATANIATAAQNGILSLLGEANDTYSYDSGIVTNLIYLSTYNISGTQITTTALVRGMGLASKLFIFNSNIYFLGIYSSINQPTYFLINLNGKVVAKLAYQNGGAYSITGLPNITIIGNTVYIPYLIKDILVPVNTTQGATVSSALYTQTGINLVNFNFTSNINTAEIGNNLHLSGGILWMYDGYLPVEHNFLLFPDYVELTVSHSGGSMTTQDYYYQAVYSWTDNMGNVFFSTPSIPIHAPSASFTSSSNSVTIYVPTLRLTYKIANPVTILLYRWSTAQQSYYEVTSVTSPIINNTAIDSISFVDTLADSSIIGNSLIYTTGGVLGDTAAPATSIMCLYKSRLLLVDAEDTNLLWFSKQVIEATPVELTPLFTIYIAPTTSQQTNTGPITALSAMDDKLIIFKRESCFYMTFEGPDITGNNSDIGEPIFITSVVGCVNQNSIVFTPSGLIFQSDKGLWLLGRDLSTSYIGAPVQSFNSYLVVSALTDPGTTQVRFSLNNGVVLMYDYYYQQWGAFYGIQNISSTIYQNLHTYIDQYGRVFQESIGNYLDGSNPVLMQFTTAWFNLAGLQSLQRVYEFFFLGTYLSPHLLNIQIAYDYSPSASQSDLITPDNYSGTWGSSPLWGNSPYWGGQASLEQWRIYFEQQKVQSFQISVQEIFDPSYGTIAGAGFTMSGINLSVGTIKTRPLISPTRTIG